jgi:hypothetical protein
VSELTVFGENGAEVLPRTHHLWARTRRITIRMTAVPNTRDRTVLLTAADHPIAPCRSPRSDTSGCDARLEVDARTVALIYCADWRHVERLCSTRATFWSARHTELLASR